MGSRAVLHCGVGPTDRLTSWAVFVPGFTGSKEDFIALPELLADVEVGLLSFDQLGQHESDGSSDPADYDLSQLAQDLGELVEQAARRLGRADPPHLVGHSFGGLVAQQAVAMGAVRPASLVLLCTGPGALPDHRWGSLPALVDALPHVSLEDLWMGKRQMERAAAAAAGQLSEPDPEVEAFMQVRWARNHPEQLRVFAQHLMTQPLLTPALRARLACEPADAPLPVAVLWGEHDDAWPIQDQVELAEQLGAAAIEIPGSGHSPNADDPAGLVRALSQVWSVQPRSQP